MHANFYLIFTHLLNDTARELHTRTRLHAFTSWISQLCAAVRATHAQATAQRVFLVYVCTRLNIFAYILLYLRAHIL